MEYTSEVQTPEDKFRVGTSAHVNMKGIGMGDFVFEILESVENENITWRGKRLNRRKLQGQILDGLLNRLQGIQ